MEYFAAYTGYDWLRLMCGLFLIPHAWGKVTSPGPLNFFKAAGFPRPAAFMYFGLIFEVVAGAALIFNFWVVPAAWLTAGFLFVATAASFKVSKGKWIWLAGGCEYPFFWALCCIIVATHSR
jgi:putative oxidoreductase